MVARLVTLALGLALALAGCGDDGYPSPGRQMLAGYLVVGNEVFAFQRCNSPLLISVDVQGNEPGFDKLGELLAPSCATCFAVAFVELDAVVSDQCPCGHLGKYSHELVIKQVVSASATPPAGCPHVEPHYPQ